MTNSRPAVRFAVERRASEPLDAGDWRVRLHTRVVRFEVKPFGGFVWNMPAAVSVRRAGEERENTVPVYDATRIAQVGLLAAGVLSLLMLRAARRR